VGQTIGGRDPNYQNKLILYLINFGTGQRALEKGGLIEHDHVNNTLRSKPSLLDFLGKALKASFGAVVNKDILRIKSVIVRRYGRSNEDFARAKTVSDNFLAKKWD